MNKYIVFLFLFFSFSIKKEEKIIWSTDYKLKWEDFKGRPNSNTLAAAVTSMTISDSYKNQTDDRVLLDVQCEFNTKKSWVKNGFATESGLRHEQYHFNLGEVFTRVLKERVLELKLFKSTARKQYDSLYVRLRKDHVAMQNLYDLDTNHSIVEVEQKRWEQKIDSMLLAYDKYAGYTRVELKVYEDE